MTPEQYKRVGKLYHAALEREPVERAAFLAEACAGDEALRREVTSLLAAHGQAGSFMDLPPDDVAAGLLAQPARGLTSGSRLGHYRMLSSLGKGGMGEVWLAEDTQLGRKVAIKLLPAEFTADAERVRRFAQEARAASSLNHPNIITIHEIGEEVGTHYIVTENVEGETLRRRMTGAPQKRIKLGEAIDIAAQIAAALSAAHEAGIVHRDIKPENVMLRPDGLVKVLDFGLAKLTEPPASADDSQASTMAGGSTETGVVMGTLRYMSPEQARGEKMDARTDIFSLGAVLYEMIAGRPPFAGATPSDVLAAILKDEPPPLAERAPEAPPELERIVNKALRKDRAQRYQVARDLLTDLRELQQQIELKAKLDKAPLGAPLAAGTPSATRKRLAIFAAAATEFQKILDHRGQAPLSVLYPLAHLGSARAAALVGDAAKSRRAYEDLFAVYKTADPDLPILIEAKRQSERR